MKRPNIESIIMPLKSFQRRTVEHAFERLFLATDSTARFLVADEVGLGKTLVARGIIARAIDHYWNDVDRAIQPAQASGNWSAGTIVCARHAPDDAGNRSGAQW